MSKDDAGTTREARTVPMLFATQPMPRVIEVCTRLRARGLRAWPLPAFAVEPIDADRLATAVAGLDRYDWLVLVSPTAVDVFATALGAQGLPPGCRVALIGRGSLETLAVRGLMPAEPVVLPAGSADARTLLAHPALQAVHGRRVLLIRGAQGSDEIGATLRARGARVDEMAAYRRCPATWPADSASALDAAHATRSAAAFVFTVSDAADSLARALAERSASHWHWARSQPALAVHPRIVARCIQAGWMKARPIEAGTNALAAALESV